MDNLDELAQEQKLYGEEINKIKTNFGKDPAERKKKDKYFLERLDKLKELWEQFEKNDNKIRSDYGTYIQHLYFKKDYYGQVEKIYGETKALLELGLNALRNPSQTAKHSGDNQLEKQTGQKDHSNETSDNEEHRAKAGPSHPKETENNEKIIKLRMQQAKTQAFLRIITLIENEENVQHSRAYFQQKIKTLEQYWRGLSDNYTEIVARFSFSDENEEQNFNSLEDLYLSTVIKLQESLDNLDNNNCSRVEQSITEQSALPKVKLPSLCVPTFSGNYTEWKSFHDLFTQLIHNNEKLGNAQKMYYLKTNLKGEAFKIISHLQVTDNNYNAAWQLLNNRYNNKRLLVSAQLDNLFAIPTLNAESAHGIKKIHDNTKECLAAIENIGIDTTSWGPIIVHILMQKIDRETHRLHEIGLKEPREVQKLENFYLFLENRFQALEAVAGRTKQDQRQNYNNIEKQQTNKTQQAFKGSNKQQCPVCNGSHAVFSCAKFIQLNPKQRMACVRKEKLCTNCFGTKHDNKNCRSLNSCRVCQQKHNTMLHFSDNETKMDKRVGVSHVTTRKQKQDSETSKSQQNSHGDVQVTIARRQMDKEQVLLPTALITTRNKNGYKATLRALIDQGSQASFITEDAVKRLRLTKQKINMTVCGLGANPSKIENFVNLHIHSANPEANDTQVAVTAFVLNELTKVLPAQHKEKWDWKHINNLELADPTFYKPSPIHLILGADIFSQIVLDGIIKGPEGSPIAQRTKFGWLLSGTVKNYTREQKQPSCNVGQAEIDEQLRKFWEIEDIPDKSPMTPEETEVETFYENSYIRSSDGRYTVRIPLDEDSLKQKPLGNSINQACKRLQNLEKRFEKNPLLEAEYKKFIQDYIDLKHMVLINSSVVSRNKVYYMPHHAVFKEDSTTTKLRVVFDASAKTTSGESLNDKMLAGPSLQQDLTELLIRWRMHKIAFTADIEKMYRQIKLATQDQDFHRIVWRFSPHEPIKEYKLTTVTYGTKAAPYLAIKTLQQLAKDDYKKFPIAAEILKSDFYVDDLLSGRDSLEEAIEAQNQLILLLKGGGFTLRKWMSNNPTMLQNIPDELRNHLPLPIDMDNTTKALGIHWHPTSDTFEFKVNLPKVNTPPTKRSLLSDASKLFDPLGWLVPTIIRAKILFQDLWLTGLSWDQELPPKISSEWLKIRSELINLEQLKIPRWVHFSKQGQRFELHCFCDASEKAYAAAIYFKCIPSNGVPTCTLLTAKSKVAPINRRVSLPRLELCGAVLLTKLLRKTLKALQFKQIKIYAYTDSSITLAWIRGNPSKWKTFVANRVANIQATINPNQWRHIMSKDNPADYGTRGLTASQLVNQSHWWNGPAWLIKGNIPDNKIADITTDLEARRVAISLVITDSNNSCDNLLSRFSKSATLFRVLAYSLRFINNCRRTSANRELGALKVSEIEAARTILIKAVQGKTFENELRNLTGNTSVGIHSKLLPLRPFLDKEGIIRVGGRLQEANLTYEEKHPIILPYKHPFTTLIIDDAHKKTLHGGCTLTLSYIRQRYWIIKGFSAVKQRLHNCVRCHRHRAKAHAQLMGNFPRPRVTMTRPFTNSGVDYAGPIDIRMSKGRGSKSYKGYIAIFICLSTKAIHIEAVSDMTAEAFLAAFKRFVARRGHIAHLYSDNGTNFILANKKCQSNKKNFLKQYNNAICDEMTNIGTQWHFIPPYTPHFGGLWEAGIKSIKSHLKRIVGDKKLTYEELSTVLAQIEACLNSRPLCKITDDPEDLDVLTPGHFLIGAPLIAPPAIDQSNNNMNHLTRWQLLDSLQQHFWRKWSSEYLSRLQQRPKWNSQKPNLKEGDLVLIKDENSPPTKWLLARIQETHPGKDGLVRVATVKTKQGSTKRPITKLCPLPSEGEKSTIDLVNSKEQNNKTTSTTIPNTVAEDSQGNNSHSTKAEHKVDYGKIIRKQVEEAKRKRGSRRKIRPVQGYAQLIPLEKQQQAMQQYKRRYRDDMTSSQKQPISEPIQPNTISPENPKRKRKTEVPGGSITALLCTMLLLPAIIHAVNSPVQVTPFTTYPGLYFEQVGEVRMINNEWNILAFYDLKNYWAELNGFKTCLLQLHTLCDEIKTKLKSPYCMQLWRQLNHHLEIMEHNNDILHKRHGNEYNKTRFKRSPLDIIGTVANKLFGVLSQDDAQYFEEQIDQLKKNDDHLLNLMKNQTSIIESTNNIFKKNMDQIQKQFEGFKTYIDNITSSITMAMEEIHHERLLHLCNSLTIQTTLMMIGYQGAQNALLDVVLDVHKGKIHPSLITPSQLRSQIAIIREHLPTTLTIPGEEDQDLIQLYNIIVAKVRLTSRFALFELTIPLLNTNQYQLFKLIPVPTLHQGRFAFIEPSSQYLIVSLHRDQYYPLMEGELQACTYFRAENYHCKQRHPMYNLQSNISHCEMNLLNHQPTLSPDCKIRSVEPSRIWIQLHQPNSWIYILDKEYIFNIVCGKEIIIKKLAGSGILRLLANCIIKQKSMIISSHNMYTSNFNSSLIPLTNLTQQLNEVNNWSRNEMVKSEAVWKFDPQESTVINNAINELKSKEHLPETLNSHDIHHYFFSYLLLALMTLSGAYYLYHRSCRNKTPIPRPRTTQTTTSDFELRNSTAGEDV